jgi:hypothetical protein
VVDFWGNKRSSGLWSTEKGDESGRKQTMSRDVKITYINKTMNPDKPTIFLFARNLVPRFDVLTHGIAWRALARIGKGSYSEFIYPAATSVRALWGDGYRTRSLEAETGKRYTVKEESGGIVLIPTGNAAHTHAIEISSRVKVDGGIQAQLCKDGKVLLEKKAVAYEQKATFILRPALYWGMAAEIREGQGIGSAILNTDRFFQQDIDGVTWAMVTLTGNTKEGYQFRVENHY